MVPLFSVHGVLLVATLAFGVLLATGFPLFVQARIAMLDVFFVAFLALALWQCAAAVREPENGRWRLALTNTAPIAAYRGAGRPEATYFVERAMDMLVRELKMDPAEFTIELHSPDQAEQYLGRPGVEQVDSRTIIARADTFWNLWDRFWKPF